MSPLPQKSKFSKSQTLGQGYAQTSRTHGLDMPTIRANQQIRDHIDNQKPKNKPTTPPIPTEPEDTIDTNPDTNQQLASQPQQVDNTTKQPTSPTITKKSPNTTTTTPPAAAPQTANETAEVPPQPEPWG